MQPQRLIKSLQKMWYRKQIALEVFFKSITFVYAHSAVLIPTT